MIAGADEPVQRWSDVPVIHELCNGQGCRTCNHSGEITIRIDHSKDPK